MIKMKDMNMRSINCNASGLLSRLALVVALLTGVLSAQGQGNNSEPAVGADVTALCSVTPAYSTDGKFTFTMPDYSVYAEIEYIESYSLSGEKVFFYSENSINPITAAAEGETVTVSFDYDASIVNKYFTGRYTSDDVTITTNEVGDGTFTMPAKAVTVTPVLAQQEEYVINLTTATTQTIPESMWILLNTLDKYLVPNEKGDLILDLNEDLKYDIQLIEDYNEAAGVSTYSVLRLEGADDITSPIQLPLSYVHNLQYNSVLFVLNTPKPIQSEWITVGDGTPLVYNGQAQTPAVVVKYGTTVLSAETDYEVTYDNNKNAGTAKVTVTAKATSMSYTGTATTTFTIAPKVVTSPTITLSATTAAYTGSDLTPTVTAVKDGETTIADTEYTVSYKKGSETVNKCIEPGEYTVVISDGEGGNYTVSGTATFTITKEAIDAVINLIDAIGTVDYTDASKAKIGAARTAYDALSEAQQALVTNYATLTDAEASYQTLKEAAEKAAAEQAAAELAAKQKAFEEGITAEDYSGTYDGQTHIITMKIPEGATVKYGTEIDKYGTDIPSFKDAGTYIVYYEVSMEGLTSVTGSANVEITRKALELVADPKTIIEGEALPDFTGSITGFVTGESLGDADVLTFSVEGPPSTEGEYAVTGKLNNEASGNYGKNYTFDNAAANETAFTINPIPTCTLGGLIYKITSTSQHTAELKEYEDDGPTGELVIPATIEYEGTDYTVTSIGDGALVFCSGLTSVTIPASVKRIGDAAFATCTGLTSVTIPDGVTSIGKSAFETTNLASVTIPASVTSVGESAFHNCQKLESVTVYTPSVPTSDGQIFTGRKSKVKVNVYVLSELVKAFTNDENWSTNADIKAMVSITTQPTSSLELTAGDESGNVLKVEATAADGYTLTYQWFANTSVSNEGGTAISGATMASYTVPTTTANTYYYYCVVTATRTDKKFTVTSDVATVTVKEKVVEKKTIENSWITVGDGKRLVYNGQVQRPKVVVKYGGTLLSADTDYKVTYKNNKDAGTATVIVTAKATSTNYTGRAAARFPIARKALELVADPKTIVEGEALPDFTGSITGFVEGEGLKKTDVLTFSVEGTPSTEGEYAVTGTLNGKASGNYGKNYTFDNAAANETAFTINPIPTCTLGGLIYKITSTSQHTAELKEYEDDGPTGELVIPATIEYEGTDYTVTSIGDGALVFCSGLTSVTIPASVKRIGDAAFATCTGLTSVTIPDGVTSIGKSAFETTNLASVTIPASVTSVGESAFHNCQKLESVTVYTPSVPTSDGQIFTGRKSKVKVNVYVLSELVKAFTNDENWSTNADIKAMVSITTQPTSSLELTAGDESGNVLKVEATAADGYTLTYQWFANTSVSNEGGTAISGATMASYTVPTTTANTYYYYCVVTATRTDKKFTVTSDVATVTVKEKVVEKKTIENSWITVGDGKRLVYNGQVQRPKVVVKYGGTLLSADTDYKVTYKNNKDAGTATVIVTAKATSTNYTGRAAARFPIARKALELVADPKTIVEGEALPDFTGSITGFVEGEGLKKTDVLTFSVEGTPSTEGEYAVTGTLNGKASGKYGKNYTFRNAAANKTAFTINPIPTFTYNGLTYKITSMSLRTVELTGYEGDKPTGELVIPASSKYKGKKYTVNSIGDEAFMFCYDLTSVTIPKGVTSIGDVAFASCAGLTSVTIPDGVTSIGESAFETTNLASVTIPASVTSVGKSAFHNCQKLESVTVYSPSVPTTNGQIFTGHKSNVKVKVNVLSELVEDFKKDENWSTNADIMAIKTEAKIIIKYPWKRKVKENFTATIGEAEYAPQNVTKEYTFVKKGVTVNAKVTAKFVSQEGNVATYKVSKNMATKLTFGGVEWKEDGALLIRPDNISFSGADVDTSDLFFTNITSLTANSSMILVKDFENVVGIITGTKYYIGSSLEGKGKASLSDEDLIFTAETEAVKTEREQTHNTVMGMGTNCEITFTDCQVNATLEGLGLTSNTGNDGTASFAAMGGGSIRQETGSRRLMTRGGNARRPFFSISYSGARIMCKAEDVEARPVENRSKTRGTEDYLTIESGKTYDILTDEDLILTLKLSEGDILITSITLQVPEEPEEPELPGDANGDGVVNAADIVKAISDGKSQAEIDDIVKAIMGN